MFALILNASQRGFASLLCRCQGDLIYVILTIIYIFSLYILGQYIIFAFCLKTKQISSHTNIHTHYDRLNGMNGRVGLTKDIFSNLIFAHCQHLP